MNRRDFLMTASGVSAGAAAATSGTAAAADGASAPLQEGGNESDDGGGNESGGGNETDDGGGGGGETHEVTVGPGGELVFDPDSLTIAPGDTVHWVWDSDTHNVAPQSVPDGAEWEGHPPIEDTGFEYEHTFETEGTYEYVCEPHVSAGMEGTIEVTSDGGGGGGGQAEFDPEHIGVPVQKHFIGAATFTAIFATMGFIFYLLKYGESANTSYPNKKD